MERRFLVHAIISGLCLVVTAAANPALAGVGASPLKQAVTVKPGEVGKAVVRISNKDADEHASTAEVRIQILDVEATVDGGLVFHGPGAMKHSASKWISPSSSSLTLAPNHVEPMEFKISPPESTPPGEYYAAVIVSTISRMNQGSSVGLELRIASGIFVTVSGGTLPRQAKIERCELSWPDPAKAAASQISAGEQAAATQPADLLPKVSLLVHNTGRARFDATGKIRIHDARSRELFSAPLVSKRPCIFEGDRRLFEAAITKPLPAGKYTLKTEVDYESAWGKARKQMSIEILPEQAALLAAMNRRYREGQPPIEVKPEKISVSAVPGATRSLALSVRNVSDGSVRGTAVAAPSDGAATAGWITVSPANLTISEAGRKTVAVRVQVPAGVAGGTYTSAVILKVGSEGSPLLERVVPVEIEVQAEK